MPMTPTEARQRWCPMGRRTDDHLDCCIALQCMLWQRVPGDPLRILGYTEAQWQYVEKNLARRPLPAVMHRQAWINNEMISPDQIPPHESLDEGLGRCGLESPAAETNQ